MEPQPFHPLDYLSVVNRRKWWFVVAARAAASSLGAVAVAVLAEEVPVEGRPSACSRRRSRPNCCAA